MVGNRRLTKPTLGVVLGTGCATTVPAGQIIEIPDAVPEGYLTVDVIWDGKQLMMFLSDLEDRSQNIGSASSAEREGGEIV